MKINASRVKNAISHRKNNFEKHLKVLFRSEHLFGERKLLLHDHECACVILTSNSEYFIDYLLEYHLNIGIKHFLIIDNGSTDNTLDICKRHKNVSCVRNLLPVRVYESEIRRILSQKYFSGGWLLFIDTDELFDFESKEHSIVDLIKYNNENKFDSTVCQVVDFFSELTLDETSYLSFKESIDLFNLYSNNFIDSYEYGDSSSPLAYFLKDNTCISADIRLLYGGLRKEIFGENCCLTTHRLVKNSSHIGIYSHPHCASRVRVSDFTAVIRHYKFCGDFIYRNNLQVKNRTWDHGEDRKRKEFFEKNNALIKPKNFSTFSKIEDLRGTQFLVSTQNRDQ